MGPGALLISGGGALAIGGNWSYSLAYQLMALLMGIGMLTVLIRVFNPAYPEGIMLAILFMNLFSPLMDHIEIRLRIKKRIINV